MSPAAEINTGQKNSFLFKDIFAKLRPETGPQPYLYCRAKADSRARP
jgi:hypothetical protein